MSVLLAVVSWGVVLAGCRPASDSAPDRADSSTPSDAHSPQPGPSIDSAKAPAPTIPEGWKVYTPLEGDFSVIAPSDPVVSISDLPMWKLRSYTFKKGEATMVLDIYADRTGVLATNTVEELRETDDDPDYVAGTLRDISLPGMPGIEFRTRGRVGEVVFREFCSPDLSRSLSFVVRKDVGGGWSESEIAAFLNSFQFSIDET